MTVTVRDMPVVVIVILGKRVTVDGEAIYHDGSRPLGEVAAEAVAELFARPLGRPVRAVASDQAGTCTLVVHPNGTWSNVAPVTSTECEHFPEFGDPTVGAVAASLPHVPVSHVRSASTSTDPAESTSRRTWVVALAVAALFVVAVGVSGRLLSDESAGQLAEPPPRAPSASASPEPAAAPPASQAPAPTKITGIARQRPGGPVRLTIRSSVTPLSVDVVLQPVGGKKPLRRTVVIPSTSSQDRGRSVQVFSELAPQVYRWRVLAEGRVVTGTVTVRAAEVVEPPAPVVVASEPTETPATPKQPSRPPPSGPRGNEPIPPKPQP